MPSRKSELIFKDREIERSLDEAGAIATKVLRRYHRRFGKVMNKSAVNLLTKADLESERRVVNYLRRRHPDHSIVAEESWDGSKPFPAGYAWVIDPLDGTTNYAHGLDHYAVSIALVRDGKPVAGLVIDPERELTYRALLGRGATRNGKRIHVSNHSGLSQCLIVTGFPYDRRAHIPDLMALYGAFMNLTHDLRRFGVASLDLAAVACGQLDGYYEPGLKPWDTAAGWLLVTEAGGKMTQYDGRAFGLESPNLIAASPKIHREMMKVIQATLTRTSRSRA